MNKNRYNDYIGLRIASAWREELEKISKTTGRSVATLVRFAIEEWLRKDAK